jgi:hypothetical protein
LCGFGHKEAESCLSLEGAEDEESPADVSDGAAPAAAEEESTATALSAEQIPALLGTLVRDLTGPERPPSAPVAVRPEASHVQDSIDALSLRGGPADTPAVRDFHQLRIAFESVWMELFDEDVVKNGAKLYTQLVEAGVDPNDYLESPIEHFMGQALNLSAAVGLMGNGAADPEPADTSWRGIVRVFSVTPAQLRALDPETAEQLAAIASEVTALEDPSGAPGLAAEWRQTMEQLGIPTSQIDAIEATIKAKALTERLDRARVKRREGTRIIEWADALLNAGTDQYAQFSQVLTDLAAGLKQPYRFSVYAANGHERSVNFGVVTTFRQVWDPVAYQAGALVKTVPLAPKETRKFTKKQVVRRERAERESDNSLEARRAERTETARAEVEIFAKATAKTNFELRTEGGVNIAIANAKASGAFAHEAATDSHETKKEFREAVFKAAEEYKAERALEIKVTEFDESTADEAGEISNPNDEIPVTYLFYELERRYRVSEHLRAVTPIVLVAQEMPKPNQIDEDWILAHDWILRRVLLDDSFAPALDYLATRVVGDDIAVQEQYQHVRRLRKLVEELKDEHLLLEKMSGQRWQALQAAISNRALAIQAEEEDDGVMPFGGVAVVPTSVTGVFGGSPESPEAARVREDAAREELDRLVRQSKEVVAKLEREETALNAAQADYTKALSGHVNRKAQIARLRTHIKANILYYMQAIWSHEPPDQRYFRLHEVMVPVLKGERTYAVEDVPDAIPTPPDWKKPTKVVMKVQLDPTLEYKHLEEVADLDGLLGFKGNYMIFPLRERNDLTDFMTLPYVDPSLGVRDPDPAAGWTLSELSDYICCLKQHSTEKEFDRKRPGLIEAYTALIARPRIDEEELVVPTASLFIEALPGAHPILEDFKLLHRAVDVKKVQAETRGLELENVRAAARLLAGEREDPTIERKIVVEGQTDVIVPPDG